MSKNRYLIVSLPKSGTHLLNGLLNSALGSDRQLFIHFDDLTLEYRASLNTNEFAGNRDKWINFHDDLPYAFYTGHKFTDAELLLYIIRENEVAMSHLTRRQVPIQLDRSFCYVFLTRNIESIIASAINTEIKIARVNPSLLNPLLLDINFNHLSDHEIPFLIQRYFDMQVPHFLEMLYWQFSNRVLFINYQDVISRSPLLEKLIHDVTGNVADKKQLTKYFEVADYNKSTKLETEDKLISEEIVLKTLGTNQIFKQLNKQIDRLTA